MVAGSTFDAVAKRLDIHLDFPRGSRCGVKRVSVPWACDGSGFTLLFEALVMLEGINSLVQAAKAKARGYRSTRNLKAIVSLIAGKLEIRLPT